MPESQQFEIIGQRSIGRQVLDQRSRKLQQALDDRFAYKFRLAFHQESNPVLAGVTNQFNVKMIFFNPGKQTIRDQSKPQFIPTQD